MTIYLFPGWDSLLKGMRWILFNSFPEQTDIASDILSSSIKGICFFDRYGYLSSANFFRSVSYVVKFLSYQQRVIQSSDDQPDFLLGHSLAEVNVPPAFDAISFDDVIQQLFFFG